VRNRCSKRLDAPITGMLKAYAGAAGVEAEDLRLQESRATAARNPLERRADIAIVQKWFAQASLATTRLYDP